MTQPIVYCPDFDTGAIPGAITDMSYWAPLYSGSFGSAGIYNLWSAEGNAAILAKVFPQIDGSQRLFVFSNESWDEYSAAGTRTNRHTPSTPNDSTEYDPEAPLVAASWGNMIIATNYRDAPQKSTGGAFSALGGTPPKARLIAVNLNFVMLGDTDDGSTPYGDEVFWSALQNPENWTPDIATQCGRICLLNTPGNLTQLVAFRDKFYAFKRDSFYEGTYVGPPLLFNWRVVSSRVGATGQPGQGVVELDDKLYFVHQSGLYEFDGAGLRNVAIPVWRTALDEVGFTGTPESGTGVALSKSRLIADDLEGVVWWMGYTYTAPSYYGHLYGYNVRTQKWSRYGVTAGAALYPTFVQGTHDSMRLMLGATADIDGRVWLVDNVSANSYMSELRYPTEWNAFSGTVTTALSGSPGGSSPVTGVLYRATPGTSAAPFAECSVQGYVDETTHIGAQSAAGVYNSNFGRFDLTMAARYHRATLTGGTNAKCILAGLGLEYAPPARR